MTSEGVTPGSLGMSRTGFAAAKAIKMAEGSSEGEALEWMRRRFRKHTPDDVGARIVHEMHRLHAEGVLGVGWYEGVWTEKPRLVVWVDQLVQHPSQTDAIWNALCDVTDTVCEMDIVRRPPVGVTWWLPRRPETGAMLDVLAGNRHVVPERDLVGFLQGEFTGIRISRIRRLMDALCGINLAVRHGEGILLQRYAMMTSTGEAMRRLLTRVCLPQGLFGGGRKEEDDPDRTTELWLFAVVPDETPDGLIGLNTLLDIGEGLPCSMTVEAMRRSEFERQNRIPGTRAHFVKSGSVLIPLRDAD
jgi:hypothetical protein